MRIDRTGLALGSLIKGLTDPLVCNQIFRSDSAPNPTGNSRGIATALTKGGFRTATQERLVRTGLVSCLAIVLAVQPLAAQPVDTTRISTKPLFVKNDLFVGAAFVAAAFAAAPVDKYFAEKLRRDTSHLNDLAENAASFFEWMGSPGPILIGPALYAAGKVSKNKDMADLGLHGTEAVLVGSAIVTLGKGLAGRARPYQDPDNPRNFHLNRGWKHEEYRSFPSGHSLAGFAAAAAVTAETARWWPRAKWVIGPAMYGGAALIATSRMYHNKHWASDVIIGAGIGTFAGLKVVRYHHSHPGNRIDKWLLSANITPGNSGTTLLSWSVLPTK